MGAATADGQGMNPRLGRPEEKRRAEPAGEPTRLLRAERSTEGSASDTGSNPVPSLLPGSKPEAKQAKLAEQTARSGGRKGLKDRKAH